MNLYRKQLLGLGADNESIHAHEKLFLHDRIIGKKLIIKQRFSNSLVSQYTLHFCRNTAVQPLILLKGKGGPEVGWCLTGSTPKPRRR